MNRIPYDNLPPRPRTRIDDLRDLLPYIAFAFIGFAIIIWFEKTLNSFFYWIFKDVPLWLWSEFLAASPPMKFFILGIVFLSMWYLMSLRSRNKRQPYNRRF